MMVILIRKLSLSALASVCLIGLHPTAATDELCDPKDKINLPSSINIGSITPVKDGMSKEEARIAIQAFLKEEVFKPQNEIHKEDIKTVELQSKNTVGTYKIMTLKDNTKWVIATSRGGLQRFLGALYLRKAIDHADLKNWRAVETKFIMKNPENDITVTVKRSQEEPLIDIFTIGSDDFITVSRYAGDQKPSSDFDPAKTINFTKHTCFRDLAANANLRIQEGDNTIIVIDTEYGSFYNDGTVKTPSLQTQLDLSDATFTFSKASLH
jgi:hypothetical protein